MNEENINVNELTISGTINSICESDFEKEYIKFGMTIKKYSKREEKIYISLNVKSDLYNIYKDLFFKDNFIYIKGYMNSYIDKNKIIKSFITVTDVAKTYKEIMNGKATPYIRYDPDGVMVWNGKRCETAPWDFNNPEDVKKYKELEDMLKEFR